MHGLPAADLQAYPPHRWRLAGQCPARWLAGGLAAPAPRARVDCGAGGGWLRAAGGAGGLCVLEALALLLYWLYWLVARRPRWLGVNGGCTLDRLDPYRTRTKKSLAIVLIGNVLAVIFLPCGR